MLTICAIHCSRSSYIYLSKLQKAREGKVLAVHRPPFGFRYNDTRDNYLVDAERMEVIERIFRMVGVEGYTMNATRLAFNREDVRPPSGGFWSPKYIQVYGMLRLRVEVAADGTMVA
jgi:hypothetical protein